MGHRAHPKSYITLKLVLGVGLITVGGWGGKGTVVPGVSLDSIFDSSSLNKKWTNFMTQNAIPIQKLSKPTSVSYR